MSEIFEREPEYGNSVGRVNCTGYNGMKWYPLQLDDGSRSLIVLDHALAEVFEGHSFYMKSYVELAANATSHIMFVTPNTDVSVHFSYIISSEAEAEINLYESAGGTTGSAIPYFNQNRTSATTSGTIPYFMTTVTTAGTLISSSITGSGRSSGGNDPSIDERIAKNNNKYIMRFKNNDGTATRYINYFYNWHEHTDLD